MSTSPLNTIKKVVQIYSQLPALFTRLLILSLFHVIFSTDVSDDSSASVLWLHHSMQALKNSQNMHTFFLPLPIFA